jgi:integrase/recombinase XerD
MAQAKTLTADDTQRVLDYIAARAHAERNRAMFLLTAWAGLRVGEVAGLRVGDVRAQDGSVRSQLHLAADRVKHAHARTVFINARLSRALAQYLSTRTQSDDAAPLFPTQKNPRRGFTANTLCQTFHSIYRGAGVAGASSHSGRRSFITTLASKGVGVRVLATLAGHRSIATTQRYIDVNDDLLRGAVELA